MIDPKQFVELVIRPTLLEAGLWSPWAERLLFGTALVESNLTWIRQTPAGPALGVYQMEPATHDDIWANWLAHKPALNATARRFSRASSVPGMARPQADEMVSNMAYATIMCRIHYYRARFMIPTESAPESLARIWKTHYNTHLGAGRPEEFVRRLSHFPVDLFARPPRVSR